MVEIKLTPDQFADKCAKLRAEAGIELSGEKGTLSKDGIQADYAYDGATLTVTVTKHPSIEPIGLIESKLRAWLTA